ncbi:MAG: phage tail terminator-like protein [Deferribacterales bacterium]
MSNTLIHKALRKRLQTLSYPIAFENVSFAPADGTLYLRENFLPAKSVDLVVGFTDGVRDFTGIYQVTICSPSGGGKSVADAACDVVEELFKRGSMFDGVQILKSPDRHSAKISGAWFLAPISIYYRSFMS